MTTAHTDSVLIENALVLDPESGQYTPDRRILVRGDRVEEVGGGEVSAATGSRIIDAAGRCVIPGLIDAHVHVTAVTADLAAQAEWSANYVAARTAAVMKSMLHRGFTTVRDVGGADYGLAAAVEEGFITGPRLLFGGKAMSQTGGHADMRHRGRTTLDQHQCCPNIGLVCDGVDEVRRAARHQLRTGADHIKIMLSGGVASPTDRVDSTQFSVEEIRAAVEEAEAANRYVAGHAYTARAINRGLAAGVRSIEHGNLLDEESIKLFVDHQAFYVPTLVTYSALASEGREHGLPEDSYRKVSDVLERGLAALEAAHRGGVNLVFGTDLLGGMHRFQLEEFRIRAEVQPVVDIIRSATTVAARLACKEGELGVVAPGAYADLLILERDPLEDVSVLTSPDKHLKCLMKSGQVVVDKLDR